ncbi:MAG: DUF58 domain-containing protein [Gammaproteobacteria bacterium]|nr:DUF58 domain-containing protein [Gammaproteobacteria bacterium]
MSDSIVLERLPLSASRDMLLVLNLKRQRVYILPTRQGISFSVLLLTMLLGAVNYNNSLAYLLTFLLASMLMICILHTFRNIAGLVMSNSPAEPVFAGDMANFPITIDNRNGQIRPALRFVCHPKQSLFKKPRLQAYQPVVVDVRADQYQRIYISMPAPHRGLLRLERIMISTRFPLGLFQAWSYFNINQECVVYPRPDGHNQIPAPISANMQGQDGLQTGTYDFVGFRHYQPGDSIRNIAWKTLAREQELLVKRFSGEGGHTLMLTWDDVIHLPLIEGRLSQLCRWIITAEQQGLFYGLDIPGKRIEPGRGVVQQGKCLGALARFGLDDET